MRRAGLPSRAVRGTRGTATRTMQRIYGWLSPIARNEDQGPQHAPRLIGDCLFLHPFVGDDVEIPETICTDASRSFALWLNYPPYALEG